MTLCGAEIFLDKIMRWTTYNILLDDSLSRGQRKDDGGCAVFILRVRRSVKGVVWPKRAVSTTLADQSPLQVLFNKNKY